MIIQKARDVLICLSVLEGGDWNRILRRVQKNELPSDEEIDAIMKGLKCKCLTYVDAEYPQWLKMMRCPPFVLFYYGDISLLLKEPEKCLAVIGSREYSEYGANATREIVKDVAKELVIVSGLAKGIDTIAAETAIAHGGKTIAILGSGIDNCYPLENIPLYNQIKSQHLLISEYPGKTTPDSYHFPFRNRLIAYLSKCILVTEAGERSGTSITVNWGLCSGKNIMCIPYPFGVSSACHRLIKEGALLVENGNDVLEFMK